MKSSRLLSWIIIIPLILGFAAAERCSSTDKESVFQSNNAYTYQFKSEALAQAVGTTEDYSKVVLKCEVLISHDRTCYYVLNLRNCLLTAAGGEPGSEIPWIDQKPLPDLSRYPVVFQLVEGEIKEVIVHQDDQIKNVNIKRGVLTAFVFKLSQTKEKVQKNQTDIHGTCPMTSIPILDSDADVRTTKDMLHCHYPSRPDWQFSPWSIFWNMSFIQHVINSTTDCTYKTSPSEKRIEKVFCKERHAIMLESTHRTTTAVQTNVFYYMDFVKSEIQNSKPTVSALSRKTDIRYEYEDTPVPTSSPPDFVDIAVKLLSDIVLDSVNEVQLFTIPHFTDLVAWIRSSHDLTPLVDRVKFCQFLPEEIPCDDRIKELAFSYLSDALVQCNSLPCAKSITYLAKNDDISPTYLNFVFHTWSYMHYSKPGFISNFVELCTAKESQQCWLSVGTFVHRILTRNNDLEGEILNEVKEVANYIHNRIEEDCEVTEGADNSHYTSCIIFLKAASNLGTFYSKLLPDGISRLLEHATNDNSPTFVRTSALEGVKETYTEEKSRFIYEEILPLLKNTSLPSTVRILSYDILILVPEDNHLEEHLLSILKEEKNFEVKFYIAESLSSLLADSEFKRRRHRFVSSLNELLQDNDLSLEVVMYETKGKSKSSSHSLFFHLPFLPESMKKFRLKAMETTLYDSFVYPTILNQENIVELFSNLIPTSKLGSYFEGWEELFLAYQKNLADMDTKSASFPKIYEAVLQTLEEYGSKTGVDYLNIDENILLNIRKIHQIYWRHHKKLDPYAKGYLDLFGSTIKYMVQDSFEQASRNKELVKIIRYLRKDLEDGVEYNTTRVIRIIEAYHQVPTMMGLPLNWTTNATLAFSLRTGLKYKYDLQENKIHSKGFFKPSVALTFLNRMVLNFPEFTQIGVQANSSGYSSTEIRFQYNSAKGKQTLRFERPSRTQKILQLFRTNQLIKHNTYVDIPDWDIERTSSSWCTKGSTNEVAGLKLCLSKSYPNVTHRIKPWALMAGHCEWQLLAHPVDQNKVHYDIQFQETAKQRTKEYSAKFSVSGKEKEKAAHFNVVMDEGGKDSKVELKTSLSPDFLLSLKRSDLSRNRKISGLKFEAILKLYKDFKYQAEYSMESRHQKPISSTKNPSDENSQILIDECIISLQTPYDSYNFNKTIYKQGENTKAEAIVEYENFKSKSNWMRMILPSSFWADDKRAMAKFLLHWKKPIYLSDDTVTRQTEFRVVVPDFTISLLAGSLKMKNRENIYIKLAKYNLKYEKLESFFNFTYDYWCDENVSDINKEIRTVNITVPRRSWSAMYQKESEGREKFKHEVKLKRVLMKLKDGNQSDYVGWWSKEVDDQFYLHNREINLVVDFQMPFIHPEDLLKKYPDTLSRDDMENLGSSIVISKVELSYPISDKVESLTFSGYFIMSQGMFTYRFQKTFDLTNTYNNLQLTSHSVYRTDFDSTTLTHRSYFMYLPSGSKSYNTIYYKNLAPEGQCKKISFKHDIRSEVFDLSTDASYQCESENDNLYTLLLKVKTNSSKWDMLNTSVDQIIQDVSENYRREDATLSHPLGTIHTEAEWHGFFKDLQKKFTVCSKEGNCPNAELYIESKSDGRGSWKLNLPNQKDTQLTYERKVSSDYKTLHVKLGHSNEEKSFVEFFDFTGEIIANQFNVWKGMVDVKTFSMVKDLVSSAYEVAADTVIAAAKDKDHPLNEILEPRLKMTLYDYYKSVKTEVLEFFSLSWLEVREGLDTLWSFLDPTYIIVSNSVTGIRHIFISAYDAIKDKSVTIWAINYFHLPYYVKQCFLNIPQGIQELMKQFALGEESVLHFKFITGKLLSFTSLREWPEIQFYPSWISSIVNHASDDIISLQKPDKTEKIAMIFGPQHIYTFDGHLYDVAPYPHEDCVLLLAHDVHKSLFTAFSSEKGIHILFPEMSITIDNHNEVFINGSQVPSSLPIQASNGKVTVKRGHTVEVWSPSLSVVCSDRHFLCILKLKYFHTGGVIGLLGNADECLENEFTLPNGNITSNLLEHTKSYEISGRTECQNFVSIPKPSPSEDGLRVCETTFGNACYGQAQVRERFLQACVSDVKQGHGPCYAAAGLSALCHMKFSASHTACNSSHQKSTQIGRNLEVIIVVQESKHLTSSEHSSAPVKGIKSLLRAIDGKFKDSGYGNVLYSLVAFGGNGVHRSPAIHSSRKEIWTPVEEMVDDVLNTLEFKSQEDGDAVSALKFALDELGYDTFGSKVVVVVTVKDRQVAEKSITEYLKRHLEENGITLYTISSYPSIDKGKKVFGVRTDGLIFPSQTKGGEAYLDYPRGNLAKLTSSTRGSLFLSKFLRDNQPSSYFTEFAQEVWAKVNKESQKCRKCKSVKTGWWWYKNECTIVAC